MDQDFIFGTVGSPISTPPRPGGSIGAVRRLAELGLFALELGWVQSVRVTETTCQLIRENASTAKVRLSVHAPYFINLNADEEEWPKSRKRLMDAAHFGNLAGATDIIFHPGSYFGNPAADVLKKAIPRLTGCISELRIAGNPVTLRPETMGKSALLGTMADCIQLSKEIEGVEPCIDFAHLHARAGDGSLNSYSEWKTLLDDYANRLGEQRLKSLHIHLSGIEYSAKGEQNHLPLQESDFNLDDLIRALKSMQCQGRILCESPVMEDDALLIMRRWNEID